MLDLKSNKSIILGLGDLKLSDTEYTFKKETIINGICYSPIFPYDLLNRNVGYERLLYNVIVGSARCGVEIAKKEKKLFYGFGANRISSNASNIVLGFLTTEYSYLIKEYFSSSSIYDKNPELIKREIIRILDLKNENAKYEELSVWDIYSRKIQIPNEAFAYWKILEPRIIDFQDAFQEEQLNQLHLRRKR